MEQSYERIKFGYSKSLRKDIIAKERSVNMRTEEIFSKRLKSSMGKMTQRQLVAKIGTTEVTVSRWLNGSRIPKLTDAVRIASVVNYPDLWLMP